MSFLLEQFKSLPVIQYAFFGIRAGVLALILKALWTMYRKIPKGLTAYLLMSFALLATALFDLPILLVLVFCAGVGLITSLLAKRRKS